MGEDRDVYIMNNLGMPLSVQIELEIFFSTFQLLEGFLRVFCAAFCFRSPVFPTQHPI